MLEFWEVSFIRISATSLSHCRENTRVAFLLKRNLKAHRIVCKLISVISKSFIMSRSVYVMIIRTIVCLMHSHNFSDMRNLQFYFGHKLLYSTVSNETPLSVHPVFRVMDKHQWYKHSCHIYAARTLIMLLKTSPNIVLVSSIDSLFKRHIAWLE